jgi:methyl-accepting chemotaxis protein
MLRFNIAAKLSLLSVIAIGALIGIGVYGFFNAQTTFHWIGDVYDGSRKLEKLIRDVGFNISKVRATSLELVTAPDKKTQQNLYQQNKNLIARTDEALAKWRNIEKDNMQNLSDLTLAWEQYKKLFDQTAQYTFDGYHEAAFINASGAERQQFESLFEQFFIWLDAEVTHAESVYDKANKNYEETRFFYIGVVIFFALLAIVVSTLISRHISAALHRAVAVMNSISDGNLDVQIKDKRSDEIGMLFDSMERMTRNLQTITHALLTVSKRLADGYMSTRIQADFPGDFNIIKQSTNSMSSQLQDVIEETRHSLGNIASGDLTTRIQGHFPGDVKDIKDAANEMGERLEFIMGNTGASVRHMAHGSAQVNATAQMLSQGSSEQAASLEQTTSSIEQMTATISQNSDNAVHTKKISVDCAEKATQGGEAVNDTVSAMRQIVKKISIIEEIAYQTNLLALNAAIEAARAGSHGKGFAVVAMEVRTLAERSQEAAQEISEITGASMEVAERAGSLLNEIVPAIRKTAELVSEIAAASEEQKANIEQINQSMLQLDQLTQQNASSAEELAASSEEMSAQATELQNQVAYFTVKKHLETDAATDEKPAPKARHQPAAEKSSKPELGSPKDEKDFENFD